MDGAYRHQDEHDSVACAYQGPFIEWIEPYGPNNEPVYMRVAEPTAIATMRASALRKGHVYESDTQALQDFMTVNWAQRIEDK